MDFLKSEKHGTAYKIADWNDNKVWRLIGVPIMQDGSLSLESEFEVDLVNAFTMEELAEFYMEMSNLFNNDWRIDEIFRDAQETYKLYLTSNMD